MLKKYRMMPYRNVSDAAREPRRQAPPPADLLRYNKH